MSRPADAGEKSQKQYAKTHPDILDKLFGLKHAPGELTHLINQENDMTAMTRFLSGVCVGVVGLVLIGSAVTGARADALAGLPEMTASGGQILTLTYNGITYTPSDLQLGTTTRWWIDGGGTEILWNPSDPSTDPSQTTPPVAGTSNPKVGDIGAHADNFILNVGTSTDISSTDGINFQQTVFPFLSSAFFIFERGGNDAGNIQAILSDGSLGGPVAFATAANGGPYANTGVSVNGQNAFGLVFTTDVPVQGIRINSSGFDALSIATPVPEPSTIALVGLGGLALWFAGRKRN
ncbi:MAG TPA: PEP-CTERM sorting domain-containing protein [Candidatus Paceibacterota bacterium]|nr:PEP-CTERM sorting domain-containing protein [Candidatus Paceibacterota bacterium]